ncbi:MAG: ribosome biogenesis GTPase Der [Candidatus Absconditabacterales bacterium]|nr:ribosome biogenesis GTPase Der [Candidatus Absconditabacterales bacterium]
MFQIGLVGATNVGKSTLFNRLIGQFRAIVTDIPGTTTDIIFHDIHVDQIGDVRFADSPGLIEFEEEWSYITKIIDESDLVFFVIDDSVGITAKEQKIYGYIMDSNKRKQTVLVVNKLDINYKSSEIDLAISDYYDLGIEQVIGVSAKQELNITELEDFIIDYFKDKEGKTENVKKENLIGIAIVGKPNVGKSTLLNTLVGTKLAKVEDYLGTTRDYITGEFSMGGKRYKIYDTAGIRKKGSIHGIEKIAYDKIKGMLKYARPAVIFMLDGEQGLTHRDLTLLSEINNLALPIIFAINKMDLLDDVQKRQIKQKVQATLDFAKYIPIAPIVSTEGTGVKEMINLVSKIKKEAEKRIDTNELNKVITTEMLQRPPRFPKNKVCKMYYITQVDINAPTFVVFVNKKERANFSFKKWIENSIRKNFGFIGTPIVIRFKERTKEKE